MHTIWKGSIGFGLVHIPVKLYAATDEKEISLQMLHKECLGQLKNQRVCSSCNSIIEGDNVVKGYMLESNQFVTFNKDELEIIQGNASKKIQIIDFVKESEIDLLYSQKVYFLGPAQHTDAYYVFLKALESSKRLAVAQFTLRSSTKICVLKVNGTCIQLATMYYPTEIRPAQNVPNLKEDYVVNPSQLKLAMQMVKSLSNSIDLSEMKNPEQERLMAAIQSKIAGQQVQTQTTNSEDTLVIDLMEALQSSVKMLKEKDSTSKTKISKKKAEVS